MSKKDVLRWIITFTFLIAFSFSAFGSFSDFTTDKAMAASINELESIEKIHKGDKVIMQFDSSVSDSFLRKFERYFSRQRLCVLTEKQFNALSNLYSISTTTLSTDNLDVEVVKVKDQDRLSTNFLERIIESSGEDPHCHVLKNNNFFYILFNFDVS